jgi:hypothetical protein
MRSPREISFRLQQELRNLQLALLPPDCKATQQPPLSQFPDPRKIAQSLAGTPFATELLRTADRISAHQFPLLGYVLETGSHIEWRRDYLHSIVTEPKYFRLVPYLDPAQSGDHKNIWELNRHQHLVLLAQAFLLSGSQKYLDPIFVQIESWWQQNPFQKGINWTSALEVAFRAFSWIWIFHFVGNHMTPQFRARFLRSLCLHGHHLANNLSFYFSPNTHLLGEAVVLHAIGDLFPSFPKARRWEKLGRETVVAQMTRMVRPDGSYFEQSSYYHVYALDMFLFHALLAQPSAEYRASLVRMADFLEALLGPERRLAFWGDDDGGRWFHPYGSRDEFGRATLATCSVYLGQDWTYATEDLYPQAAWFLGQATGSAKRTQASRLFPDTGLAALLTERSQVLFDAGPFGPGRAGHSHADTLNLIVSHGCEQILIDSGTYTYVGDPAQRDAFRGTAAHNTIRINRRDQANPVGPFWWGNPPNARVLSWELTTGEDTVTGQVEYDGFVHRRTVRFVKPHLLLVLDTITGPPGTHGLEQFWHLGFPQAKERIFFSQPHEEQNAWHSSVFGERHEGLCLVVKRTAPLPVRFVTAILLDGTGKVNVSETTEGAIFEVMAADSRQRYELAYPSETP